MSNSKIKSEWGTDCYGQRCLILQKKRGSISQQELADHLRYELKEFGIYISILNAAESTCGVGWPEEDSHGDAVVLYLYENEGSCPVCAHMAIPNYCPHCGNSIDPMKDYQEPLQVFRGESERPKPAYQLSCSYVTEGGCGVCGCGVSDSMEGIMRLLRQHVQGLISLDAYDPILTAPPPSADKLPATLKAEWDYARVQVEYTVERAQVLLGGEADVISRDNRWRENLWHYLGDDGGEDLSF